MRWPWRHRGRRRRGDVPVPSRAVTWDATWGTSFLPPAPAEAAQLQPQPQPSAAVRLGFSDGTELELKDDSGESELFRQVAARLLNHEHRR
jgi:hypothetical protein